ncbi:hypothetical protein NP233_g7086 [Leucocoprinus birnbaumii]|uniref:Uncharacterized protein n=1 Tax=Leucocoprinus birnbaumii TaxID=56174 RepID=A0AAD5VPW1_9AGAR|nr:hypothetical protein NP233_g7086 [Leucocoprinus birnbaumii]
MDPTPPTDYSSFILDVLRRTRPPPPPSTSVPAPLISQSVLRQCLGLASSFLITDLTTSPEKGLTTWLSGFSSLVDIVVALHARGELELETISEASKACSECWTAAGVWKGMEECRDGVRATAGKLKNLLDEGGKTYRGERVYAP